AEAMRRGAQAEAVGDAGSGEAASGGEAGRADRAGEEAAASVAPEEAALIAELEEELRRWVELTALLPPPGPGVPVIPPEQLDRELRQLAPMYLGFDKLVGRLCRTVQVKGTHRAVG